MTFQTEIFQGMFSTIIIIRSCKFYVTGAAKSNLRSQGNLYNYRTTRNSGSFLVAGPRIWNSTPHPIKSSSSVVQKVTENILFLSVTLARLGLQILLRETSICEPFFGSMPLPWRGIDLYHGAAILNFFPLISM